MIRFEYEFLVFVVDLMFNVMADAMVRRAT